MLVWFTVTMIAVVTALTAPDPAEFADDFEWCTPGFTIALNAESRPWLRFGEATRGQVYPTIEPDWIIDGLFSARYDLGWPATFGKVRKVAEQPINLTSLKGVSVLIRTTHPDSQTRVRLDLYDGRSTCLSRAAIPLSADVNEAVFSLAPEDLVIIDTNTEAEVKVEQILANCKAIGLHFESGGQNYVETVIFDNLNMIENTSDDQPIAYRSTN